MVRILNIEKFFLNFTCNEKRKKERYPCRNAPRTMECHRYFRERQPLDSLYMTTITIGNKFYGRMSAEGQHEHMVKAIKEHIKYYGEHKYIYHFELQKNGQLHAHGLESGTYQQKFHNDFAHFGCRNKHKKSFQKVRNLEGYLQYINKENVFPPIHNIKRSDIMYQRVEEETRRIIADDGCSASS